MTTNLTLADAPDFGYEFTLVANKAAGLVHIVADWGTTGAYSQCFVTKRDLGRTVVGKVDGYRPALAFEPPEGLVMCAACVQNVKVAQRDRAGHWLTTQKQGAAAGRTIVHEVTLRIVEHVPAEATLYSIKDAEQNLKYRLNLNPRDYDYVGKSFPKSDRYEFSADITSTFQEA